jgi:NADH-quinone oxidoreductase subunit E
MSRLNEANTILAKEIIGRYPKARSATIPLLHLAQQQHGHITDDAIAHVAELVGATSAEVLGTCTFYEMFKMAPVGKYLINICGTMSCQLLGADELMHHAEQTLGVRAGGTTADGMFTLEHAECQAACTEAPNLQVNYRHCHRMSTASFDQLVDDLRAGRLDGEIPVHGTLARVRQQIPADKSAGVASPDAPVVPSWMPEAAQ